ncbi:hypothetical protein MY5147_000233 [Beauveria neobassiana]
MEPVPNRGQFISTMVETARAAIEERDASGYFSWVRFGTVGSYAILDEALCSLAMHLVGKDHAKKWHSVMRDRGRHLLQGPEFSDQAIEAVDEFNNRLAEIPAVVKVGYPVMEAAKKGFPIDSVAAATTRRLAAACHARMSEFWSTYKHLFPDPVEAPSRDPQSLYPVILRYEARWAATLRMSHHATMCLLQEFLQQLDWTQPFATSQKEYAHIILRSVEDISQGPLGPYRIGYAMRIAYELADAEAQEWIRGCLDRFKSTYAATDKQTYPEMRTDNKGCR